jgi:two-component system, sensor histidine kinase
MRFRQIIVNLVSNAIKFTEHGSVRVETKWSRGELKLSVEDTGKGIAKDDQARVFNAFEQLGNHPGTGLGLAIVKHLVAAMGGNLSLTSDIGKGSRFELTLPAEQITIDSNGYQNTFEHPNVLEKSLLNNVLIVEDDPDIMALLQGTLSEAGYTILEASDGNEAIKKALSNWPDLILLDLNLPDMTGFEVIKTLRNYDFDNPVFAQSAWVSSEFKVKAIAAGCNEYLLKPLDFTELNALISDYFILKTDRGMPIERYKELCQQFLDSLPEKLITLQEIENNINSRNWEHSTWQALHAYTHRLAGSAGLYGMYKIADTSKQLDLLLLEYERLLPGNNSAELRDKITNAIALLTKQIIQEISIVTTSKGNNLL